MFETVIYGDVTLWELFISSLIIIIATIIAKGIAMNLRRTFRDRIGRGDLEISIKFIYLIFIGIALIIVFPYLGVDPSGLMVAGGILALVIAFASQSIVSNFISGIFLMFERPVNIGDQITLVDISGTIEDIQILSTSIRTYDGLFVRIPNEKVFTSNITNLVAYPARRYDTTIGIRTSDDPEKAMEIIKELIEDNPFILVKPDPLIFVKSLNDNSITLDIRFWTPSNEMFGVRTKFILQMKNALESHGIQTSSPRQEIYFSNELRVEQSK